MDKWDPALDEQPPHGAAGAISRRQALEGAIAVGGLLFLPMAGCQRGAPSGALAPTSGAGAQSPATESTMPGEYTLPPLPYPTNALEPVMDAKTVELHHDLHHAGYVKGANAAAAQLAAARETGDFKLVDHWTQKLAFHASGHLLHSLFWRNMAPVGKGGQPSKELEAAIGAAFSDVAKLTAQLVAVAKSVEGSGWGIVGWHPFDRSLVVLQCQNHEKLAIWSVVPLLVVDVWEHAYYLKYQNKRGEYLKAWTELINWGDVSERFAKASKLEG